MSQSQIISMGHIVGAVGLKGFVKIKTDTQTSQSLANYKQIYLQIGGVWKSYVLESYLVKDDIFQAKFAGVDDRDLAFSLKGALVGIAKSSLAPLECDDEYYWVDLIDLKVINQQDEYLGTVVNLMQTGANDVLVVKSLDDKTERLIPFVDKYVIKVDLNARQILVDWGLDY